MDIRKLQRAILDGLEDVKAQDIQVFNTEHLSPLFERVFVASGTSNRQTKALAASVRDAVKSLGERVLATEGEDNGEWIIVDCGAAVVHVMQPAIREYYRLEEIWGEKPVKLKSAGTARKGLVKASEEPDDEPAAKPAGKKAAAKKASAKAAPAKKAPAKKAAGARRPITEPATETLVVNAPKPAPRKTATKTAAKPAARPAAKKAAPARKPAGKTAARGSSR